MARVKVVEPRTGATVEVDSKSPLAKAWGSADKTTAKKASSSKSSK